MGYASARTHNESPSFGRKVNVLFRPYHDISTFSATFFEICFPVISFAFGHSPRPQPQD